MGRNPCSQTGAAFAWRREAGGRTLSLSSGQFIRNEGIDGGTAL